jgi:hypothetical protein
LALRWSGYLAGEIAAIPATEKDGGQRNRATAWRKEADMAVITLSLPLKWKVVAPAPTEMPDLEVDDQLELFIAGGKLQARKIRSGVPSVWCEEVQVTLRGKNKGTDRVFRISCTPPTSPGGKWTQAGKLYFDAPTEIGGRRSKRKDDPIGGDGHWTAEEGG